MSIKEEIEKIIEKRKGKVPELEKKKEHLSDILSSIKKVNIIRERMLDNKDHQNMNPEILDSVKLISTNEFENSMNKLITFYDNTIERFSRDEINIAVVGGARQGKSKLLQSISNLDDEIIPAFKNDDCTGASSVIKNDQVDKPIAEITFRNEVEMIEIVQKYLREIFGDKYKLNCFNDIGALSVSDLEKNIEKGSSKTPKFDHLKKYIEHFNEWRPLVNERHKRIVDPREIQKYVAQHNGEPEISLSREDYYNYLAVKEVVISCKFSNPETGSIVLRDTIGLGDTSLGISDKMLETIDIHSDATIIVRRPETSTGKFDENDEKLYDMLEKTFSKRNMEKWLFWLINKTTNESIYGDNSDRCEAFKKKIDEYKWRIADINIVDVANKEEVNKSFLPDILKILIQNIDDIDNGIMVKIEELANEAYEEYKKIYKSIKNVILQEAKSVIDTTDFLDDRWDGLYNSGLMKQLKEYKSELFSKKDNESEEFKKKVMDILEKSDELIPSEDVLLEQLQKGGKNRGIDVYTMRMDKLRTEFTRQFIDIDEEIFDKLVADFKDRIVSIFVDKNGGRFEELLSKSDYENSDEWLLDFSEKYFVKERYEQFDVAFKMLSNFSLTVRGFLMHRIRDRIDKLNPSNYKYELLSEQDEAKKLNLNLDRVRKDVVEELLRKFEDELFREPNRVFYAIISEFYDRINFSFGTNMKDVENIWKNFYTEHLLEIWNDEFKENANLNNLYKDWTEVSDDLSNITKNDFINKIKKDGGE